VGAFVGAHHWHRRAGSDDEITDIAAIASPMVSPVVPAPVLVAVGVD
jgi:hypothetical protein